MNKDFKRLTDFLLGMGVEQVPHTHKSYLTHLIAVFHSLESHGYPEYVCCAGRSTRSTAPSGSKESPFRSTPLRCSYLDR